MSVLFRRTMAKWGEGDPRWIVEERPDATNVNNWHWWIFFFDVCVCVCPGCLLGYLKIFEAQWIRSRTFLCMQKSWFPTKKIWLAWKRCQERTVGRLLTDLIRNIGRWGNRILITSETGNFGVSLLRIWKRCRKENLWLESSDVVGAQRMHPPLQKKLVIERDLKEKLRHRSEWLFRSWEEFLSQQNSPSKDWTALGVRETGSRSNGRPEGKRKGPAA